MILPRQTLPALDIDYGWNKRHDCAGEELTQLKTAVTGVREALADLKANADAAKASVIKLNVRDARDSLRRRLQQLSPETTAIQVVFAGCCWVYRFHLQSACDTPLTASLHTDVQPTV